MMLFGIFLALFGAVMLARGLKIGSNLSVSIGWLCFGLGLMLFAFGPELIWGN